MNVLFVPCLGMDGALLERLANSIDFPVKYKVALNNGTAGALEDFSNRHADWIVKESPVGNMGVAASWNWIAKTMPDEPAWLMVNEDAWFLPGYLEKICRCTDANPNEPIIYLNNSNAYYCFVWTKAGRERCGLFDENFWPAYYEDNDMRVRHRMMGIEKFVYALPDLPPLPHGKPSVGGMNYGAMIQGCGLLGRAYWYRKYGSFDFEKSSFPYPYKDHRIKPNEWVYYPEHRAKLQPLWDTFITLPNASIYT